MAEVGSAFVSILPSARGFGSQLNREVGPELDAAGKSSGGRFSSALGGVLKKTAVGIGVAAGGILGGALFKGFERLNAIEQARAKLDGLGSSAAEVDKIMANALSSVKGTAFGLDEAATTAASAVAAGIKPGKELTKYLTLVGDAAAITGTSMADMGSTLNNVQTIGAAYNDSLQIFAQKGIPVYSLLSKELGVSTAAVKQLASEGKISAETFNSVLQDKIGGAGLKAGDTFMGAFKNLQASLGRVGANLLSGVFPQLQGGFVSLTASMGMLETKAASAGAILGRALAVVIPVVVAVARAIATVVGFINQHRTAAVALTSVIVALVAITKIHAAVMAVQAAGGIVKMTVAMLRASSVAKVWTAVQWLLNAALSANPIGIVIVAIAALVAGLVIAYKRSATFRGVVTGAFNAVKGAASALGAAFMDTVGDVARFVEGSIDKVNNLLAFVRDIPGKVKAALGALGSVLYNAGQELIQGLINGITAKLGALASKMSEVASKIKGFLPGSPVKEGPLRSWNNGGAGKRLVDLLAYGLSDTRPIDGAMNRLGSRIAVPRPSADLAFAGAGGSGGGRRPLHIHIGDREIIRMIDDRIGGHVDLDDERRRAHR